MFCLRRREFLHNFATVVTAAAGARFFINDAFAADLPVTQFRKAVLLGVDGKPLQLEDIQKDAPFMFNWPYTSTPNMLLNLELPVKPLELKTDGGKSYDAPGGTGKDRTIVAYSVICPHQWSYPTKDFSVINYYDKKDPACVQGVQLIKCCAHQSIFDPKACGKRLDGPAENNLAMVVLEWDDKKKELSAVGLAGRHQFTEFFDLFKKELRKEYGSSVAAKAEVEKAQIKRLEKYSANLIKC